MKNYFRVRTLWSICLIFTSLHSNIFESSHYPKGSGFSATFNQVNSQPKNFSFQIQPFVVQQDLVSYKQVLCIKLLELLQQPSPDQLEVRHALVEQLYVVVMQLLQYSHTQSDLDKLLCLKSQCEERLRELTEAMHVVNNNEISFKNHVFLQKLKVAFAELSPDDYEQRINALDQAIAQPLANIDRTYQLSSEVYHYNPHAELFEHCSGNALEQQLHQELFDTVTEMARLLEQNPHNLYVQTNSEFVFHVTALAKVQNDPEVGFNLLDCGKSLLKFTQNFVGIVARGVVKGGVRYIESNVTMMCELATHPIDTLSQHYVMPLRCASSYFARAIFLARNNREEFLEKLDQGIFNIVDALYNDPEGVAEEAVAALFQVFAPSLTSRFAKLKHVQPIVKAFNEQKKVAAVFATSQITKQAEKIINPIKTVVNKTKKKLKKLQNEFCTPVVEEIEQVTWAGHYRKHIPKKNISWKDMIKSTRHGVAKYKPGVNRELLEKDAWITGVSTTNGKTWKVKKFDSIVGAKRGEATPYIRVEMSAGVIHGHPITELEFRGLIKK